MLDHSPQEPTTTPTLFDEMKRQLPDLCVAPDDWVREMMVWHFSEETGSAFWLSRRRDLGFDPLRDVNSVDDLRLFGLFDKSVLRTVRIGDLVPRGFADRPRRVYETGGTSGPPCRIADITLTDYNIALYRAMLAYRGLAGGDALAMTPAGPHAYGTFVRRLADSWRGNSFAIDFDPRWVKHLVRSGTSADPYLNHLVAQTETLLATQAPTLLFTTSKLLLRLVTALSEPLATYGVRAVCTGGTSCTEEEVHFIRETCLEDVAWIDTYGNTLMGHALQGDPWAGNARHAYYLPPPQAFAQLINTEDWLTEVNRGERGRVMIQTLHRDFFIPNLLERDSAIRVGPHPWFPFGGLSSVEPYTEPAENGQMVEGVY